MTISACHEHKGLKISINTVIRHVFCNPLLCFAALKIAVVDIYHSRLKERQRRKKWVFKQQSSDCVSLLQCHVCHPALLQHWAELIPCSSLADCSYAGRPAAGRFAWHCMGHSGHVVLFLCTDLHQTRGFSNGTMPENILTDWYFLGHTGDKGHPHSFALL